MQQLKIAQNNIYEKVINNLLNNITGQQAAYIFSKVPDYFQLQKQGELKQAYQKLFKIYQQLEQSKNEDLKINEEQYDKMFNKFEELSSGYNKFKKNIKASDQEYKTQQQKAQKQQLLQQYKTNKQPKQQNDENLNVTPLFEEKLNSFKKQNKQFNRKNEFKHTYSTINDLETHKKALELLPHIDNQYINHIDHNFERILNILQQVQQRANFPFKVKIYLAVETEETVQTASIINNEKIFSTHAINTDYKPVNDLNSQLSLTVHSFNEDIDKKMQTL